MTMRIHSHRIEPALGIAAMVIGCLVAASGCGRIGPERIVISGKVAYRGEPIKKGQIRFISTNDANTPAAGALILNGKYTADGNGGVPVGRHRVEIVAHLRTGLADRAAQAGNPPANREKESQAALYLPAKYNTRSELEITVKPGSGRIVQDFLLAD